MRTTLAGLVLAIATQIALAPPLPTQEPAWLADVDATVRQRLAEPEAVGFSIGVAQRDRVLLAKGYGLADLEFEAAADADTMFRIGSVTKQFTAALVLRAAERQRLSLDDPLDRFVPTFPLQGRKVTIRHLLNHSSGIPSYTSLGPAWQKTIPLELSHDELLALVAGRAFDFEPGTGFAYNNTGYYLLGMVLERVHDASFAGIVQQELCLPLGLTRTRYDSNKDLIRNRAQGYVLVAGKPANDDPLGMSQPGAAGALLSTGGDLVRWSMALARGKVVSPASYAAMTTPFVVDGRSTHYGFGLMLGDVADLPCVLHGGGIHGFNSILLHVPQHDLHVAVISNSEGASSSKLAGAIVRAVLALPEPVAKDLPLPDELLERLVGTYDFPEIGMALIVSVVDGRLTAQGDAEGQVAFPLLFQGGREFRAAFDPSFRIEWDEPAAQVTLHQGGRAASGRRR